MIGRPPASRAVPGGRGIMAALHDTLAGLAPDVRERLLCGPDLRGFLGEAEIWIAVLRLTRFPRPPAAGRRPGAGPTERLFDCVSRTEHLATLLPSGRIDRGFPARAARFARRRLRQALSDLAAAVLGARLAGPCRGALDLRLEFREDPEQARPRDRIDLGAIAGPSGALSIVAAGHRPPRGVRVRLDNGALTLSAPGAAAVLPAAGSRLRAADFAPAWSARPSARGRDAGPRTAPRLAQREMIPGTTILLGPELRVAPRRISVGREVRGLGPRLARALRLVRLAWPEACREVEAHTFMVVPVREARLVSYSLASRPGISFINVSGKTTIDLGDDLLHETAHHRLHAMEEIEDFLVRGPDTDEAQAFDSPWRGTRRPLRGIFHGCYTFLFRADLLRRVLRAARRRPGMWAGLLAPRDPAWVRREVLREAARLRRALIDLEGASRAGLLTPAGRRLLRRMRGRAGRR